MCTDCDIYITPVGTHCLQFYSTLRSNVKVFVFRCMHDVSFHRVHRFSGTGTTTSHRSIHPTNATVPWNLDLWLVYWCRSWNQNAQYSMHHFLPLRFFTTRWWCFLLWKRKFRWWFLNCQRVGDILKPNEFNYFTSLSVPFPSRSSFSIGTVEIFQFGSITKPYII